MSMLIDIISWLAILGGSFFSITGAVGLFRFPDFYSRTHAAGMTDTLGVLLLLFGLMLQNGWDINLAKYVFILMFIYFTSPTATHALAKAAMHGGLMPAVEGEIDGEIEGEVESELDSNRDEKDKAKS